MSALSLATIPAPSSNTIEIGPLTIHYYGICIALGVLLAITVLRRRYGALGGDVDLADRTALWAVGIGFLGARIGYVTPRIGDFADRPLAVFAIWEGGLALFGGLFFGTLAAIWYLRRNGVAVAPFADAAAVGIPLAQAVGRWGNYFNQELYGTPTDLPWALEVDPVRRVTPYEAFETFHPTFLYESLYNLALAGVIVWIGRRGKLRQGSLILVYAVGYGLGRFLIELLRTDTTWRFLGLSRNNWIALAVCVAGAAALRWWQRSGVDAPRVGTPLPVPAAAVAEPGAEAAVAQPGAEAEVAEPGPGAAADDPGAGAEAAPGGGAVVDAEAGASPSPAPEPDTPSGDAAAEAPPPVDVPADDVAPGEQSDTRAP